MSYRRDHRATRSALFDNYDSIEEGGIRASHSYSRYMDEHDNEKAIDNLQDRVAFLKNLTGDIHEEVESHNRMLDKMGNEMDSSRGIMSRTMDRFKMVFEKKSSRKTCKLVGWFVLSFFLIYYIFRVNSYCVPYTANKQGFSCILCTVESGTDYPAAIPELIFGL